MTAGLSVQADDAPVLLLVDDDPRRREFVEGELSRRYGADYQVRCAESASDALRVLGALRDDGRSVALVLAGYRMAGTTGIELLGRVRDFHRTAKRVLLVDWGERTPAPIVQAIGLGRIDAYVVRPTTVPDEPFHRAVTELLEELARSRPPGFQVVRVVGESWSARSHELRDLLSRNVVPSGFYPADSDQGRALLDQAGAGTATLPVIILFNGRVLENPSNVEVAEALGIQTRAGPGLYDVAVIGAGPAGLAAAVYGASEGLSTVVLEPEAIGGQAGTSSRIRNYLGFPNGVSGEDLAVRAYTQAWNFGAEYVYGSAATGLRADGEARVVAVAGGSEVRSRAVVIAAGMSYRRLGIPALEALAGVGVFYGAATAEAKAMKDQEVFVVGGANSAGQAAVHLAGYAARVTMLVRGRSLADSMSEYLVTQIAGTPNITVRTEVEVVGGAGTGRLESLTITDRASGATQTAAAAAVFVLIGAEPRTRWLPDDVVRDRWGYVVTGADLLDGGRPPGRWPLPRPPMLLESSLPGVFAAGDIRRGSVKRVASAVGEGSIAIRLVHDYLRGA
ncbi:MAG TPA: FAD-dependent oxidoreductase [Streptosporangiaceae bacterium]|nr:FAD-dependent oxidoreductase [Streptosporangiaceae bacterium]